MKRSFIAAVILITVAWSVTAAERKSSTPKHPALGSPTLVWAGLDFSQVRMIGAGQFNNPDAIFPGMLDAWNDLFVRERIPFVEATTHKKVVVDLRGVAAANKAASAKQIITSPGTDDTVKQSHITPADIAKAVKAYKLEAASGLGVVFIVDRFVKVDKRGNGAVYVVVFDIATREVIASERRVGTASGFGLRNFWFRVIKEAEPALRICR